MPDYEAIHFDPAAPVAEVELRDPSRGNLVSRVSLILDTGADVTVLPLASVGQLSASTLTEERYELMGFDGNRSTASAVMFDLVFLGRIYRGKNLLLEVNHGVLGRDVLNHISLLLDGPRQHWSECGSVVQ